MLRPHIPKDKIWWVTGDSRDSLTRTEWTGNRSKDALLKCFRKPLKKTLFSFLEYERPGEKPILISLGDLIYLGVVTDDIKNASASFKRRKKLPNLG